MKNKVFEYVDAQQEALFGLACKVFDNPEWDGQEHYACGLLSGYLAERGFAVETGIGGQETAFRATWSSGEGGPNIGILGEYDALRDRGHGCGHHMQTPAAIGAAIAVREALAGSGIPFTLTIYGTPAEETYGGKIIMADNGCFRDLDIAIGTHATRAQAFVGGGSMALKSLAVTYHGISAHAASSAAKGRSAADAMLLSFNAIEFLREHVPDGTRMHYTIKESTGPSNVVPATAKAGYTFRNYDNNILADLEQRIRDIIKGACLMTGTTAEITEAPTFAARKKNDVLARVATANLDLLQIPRHPDAVRNSGGSTDFGNVSCIVPAVMAYLPYLDTVGHSDEWISNGKSEHAVNCLMNSTRVTAGIIFDLLMDQDLIRQAKEEFDLED